MSAAICLARAGRDVELVEAQPDWRSLGAGLTLNSQSLRAFAQLGILDRVEVEGHCHGPTRLCNALGEPLLEPATREMTPGLPAGAGILRPVLHRILADETLAAGVTVRLGVRISTFKLLPDGVRVSLPDGSSDEYDALVGADGLHSTIRPMLFPDAPEPAFCGQGCWRAVFPRVEEISTGTVYVGKNHRAGLNPVSNDEMYLFVVYHEPANRYMEPRRWPELLAQEMREFGGLVGRLREQLGDHSQINYRPLESLLLPKPWSRGHALLIGDAVHATTPHLAYGAGLAVEDGLVLGETRPKRGLHIPMSFDDLPSAASTALARSSKVRFAFRSRSEPCAACGAPRGIRYNHGASMATDIIDPVLRLVMTLRVECTPFEIVGETGKGTRRLMHLQGGTFEIPAQIGGTFATPAKRGIVVGGYDWQSAARRHARESRCEV